ncbi:Tfp pilus assembly protein, major pilin PilA [Escherichia coli]|uniref:Tfp pilus assembly protein, major pilin PilA n=1 Tax=Escherichia coli TaxID=562 RepID=A0A2X3JDU2_ECOLX|nr:Tfp pilus assembly protein, major pilin PilA [Escherichia coli]
MKWYFVADAARKYIKMPHPAPIVGAPQRTASSKSRMTAALLAFFLGGLGAHKFYLGKVGQGFLYLIFCWTFIPAIVAFIEFFIYLCTSDEDFARKYG